MKFWEIAYDKKYMFGGSGYSDEYSLPLIIGVSMNL